MKHTANPTAYHKGVCCTGIKMHNKLPLKIKCLSMSRRQFKVALNEFLLTHTFHWVDEFILGTNE
jgi:hypothetical protein